MRSALAPRLAGGALILSTALLVFASAGLARGEEPPAFSEAKAGGVAPSAATVAIDVGDIWFCNSSFANGECTVTVEVGDTVVWNWVGSLPHSVTPTDSFPPDSGIRTAPVAPYSVTFSEAGTFSYVCAVHPPNDAGAPFMSGKIVVRASPTATPTQAPAAATSTPRSTATPVGTAVAPSSTPTPGAGDEPTATSTARSTATSVAAAVSPVELSGGESAAGPSAAGPSGLPEAGSGGAEPGQGRRATVLAILLGGILLLALAAERYRRSHR